MMVPDGGMQEASKAIIPILGKYYAKDNRMPATMWRLTRQAAASSGSADDVFAGISGSHLSLLYQDSSLGTVQGCAPHLHALSRVP